MAQPETSHNAGITDTNSTGPTPHPLGPAAKGTEDLERDFSIDLHIRLKSFGRRKHAKGLAMQCVRYLLSRQASVVVAYWRPSHENLDLEGTGEWEPVDLAKAKEAR